MSCLRVCQALHQFGERVDRLGELVALVAQRPEHGVEVDDDLPDQLVAVGQRVRQRRGLGEERADRSALPLECRDQLAGQRVDLVGIQRPEQRPEPADQRVQIQRRRGAGQRDRVARVELLGAAGAFLERQIAAADEVVVADDGPGALGEHHRVVGGELDQRRRVVLDGDFLTLPTSTPAMRTKSPFSSPVTLVNSAR